MFLSLKTNLNKKLNSITKYSSSAMRTNSVLNNKNKNFNFTEKVGVFDQINSSELSQSGQDNDLISKYFDEHEQYIANFYKKHKENFIFQEGQEADFEEFLIQMEKLMKHDTKRRESVNKYINDMNKITFQSREPLREVLIYYQMYLTKNGFDPEVLAETIYYLGKVNQSRENLHRVYTDFTHWDFVNSFRMYHIIDDLKYSLSYENAFMNAEHIAKALRGLTMSGYKNSEVAQFIFDRISSFLTNKKIEKKFEKFVDTPGAGKYNYHPQNRHAEDLFYDEKYRKHIFKLMQLNVQDEQAAVEGVKSSDPKNKFDEEILAPIQEIIELLKETKEVQHNLTDAIDNLLDQYYQIEQAMITNPELKDYPYIKYELFKLQDKLVEGGYLTIEALNEVTNKKLTQESLEKVKYENIVSVLKNFVLINFPNLYNEGENKLDSLLNNENKFEDFELNSYFRMTPLSLGKTLAALSDYAKITNIDINGQDYLNEKIEGEFVDPQFMKANKTQIKIKAEYTKLFNMTENYLKEIEPMVRNKVKETEDVEALGYIYYAYSNLNISSKELKTQIIEKMSTLVKNKTKISNLSNEGIKYIITGLAKGEHRNDKITQIVKKVSTKINFGEFFKLEELISMLWAMSTFKLCSNDIFIQLLIKLSENSENLVNYISNVKGFDRYLYQLSVCLKYECKDEVTIPSNLSFLVDLHLNMREFTFEKLNAGKELKDLQHIPNELLVDPMKNVVLSGLEGYFARDIAKRQSNAATNLESMDAPGTLPFFPDKVIGFYGHKVALFVFGKDYLTDESSNDTLPINGYCQTIKRVLKEKFNTHAVFIPTSQLIKFDLKTGHVDLLYSKHNEGFTHYVEDIISKQLNTSMELNSVFQINKYLNSFIKKFANSEQGDLILQTENDLENFMNSLLKVIDLHGELVSAYYPSLVQRKIEELQLNLDSNLSYFNSTSDKFKLFVNSIVKEIIGPQVDYNLFINNLSKNYLAFSKNLNTSNKINNEDLVISSEWLGKRLHVDILNKPASINDKNHSVELINNNFMWLGEYNPYADWEEEIRSSYDNFNYFVENSSNKFLFNSHKLGHRKVPQGVFPHPNKLRSIKSPLATKSLEAKSDYELQVKSYQNYNEKLIQDEVAKNALVSNKDTDSQLSLKVNLLNIKNSLKQNFSDNQILKYITNFEFIDALLVEHLNSSKANSTQNNFIQRDPEAFQNFYKKLSTVTGEYDEYDKFVMREYYNDKKIYDVDPNVSHEENIKNMEERMSRKINENEDLDTVSIYNANTVDYKFDIKSILSSIKDSQKDSDLDKQEFIRNPEAFLVHKRKVAERNLILLKIVVKLLDPNSTLSENETKYLNNLLEKTKKSDINKIEEIGVKENITDLSFKNLSANDIYSLNTLYNVEITQKSFDFSLSELILEFSHFIDSTTINKILLNLYETQVLKPKNGNSFTLFPVDNKEPALISNEIKETLWRLGGFLSEEDKTKLKGMLKVKRGKSKFDKIWLQLDEKSLDDFIQSANLQDNRLQHLEKWIKRKEKEIENRIHLPPDNLSISDTKINKLIEKKDKAFRKTLLSNIFKVDDINKIDASKARDFINEFCSSLYLFNFNYPQTIKDIFNALADIPSIYEEDKQLLKNYRLLFNVDEENPFEYLSVAPVKMEGEKLSKELHSIEEFLDENLKKRLKNATVPFVQNVVKRISILGNNNASNNDYKH
jgi:hypothetical protein